MKRHLATTAVLALAVLPARAEVLKNLRLGGQIDVQATSAHNVTDFAIQCTDANGDGACDANSANNDRQGDAQTRVMVSLDWDLLDDVHARLTLRKNDRVYGDTGANKSPQNLDNVQTNVFVDEAYFTIDKIAGLVNATMGRQFYGDSGDIVIYYGPSDKAWYGLPVSALDAGRFDWSGENLALTGVVGQTVGTGLGVSAGNTDLRGLQLTLKGYENFRASLYGWNRVIHRTGAVGTPPATGSTGGKNDNLYVVGLKSKISGGGAWLKTEFAQNFGEQRINPQTASTAAAANYMGWAALANAGFKAESDSVGSVTLWGEFAVGSGRSNTTEKHEDGFQPINADYRPGTIYGRFAANSSFAGLASGVPGTGPASLGDNARSSSSLNNRVIWGGGIKLSPAAANKLTVGVSWWDFRKHRFVQSFKDTQLPFKGNRHIGSELDADAVWTHSENVTLAAGYAVFYPGGLLYEAVRAVTPTGRGINPAKLTYFDVRVRF